MNVHVVACGHAPGEAARYAVKLHDDAEQRLHRGPDHQDPNGCTIDMARRVKAGAPRTREQRRCAGGA